MNFGGMISDYLGGILTWFVGVNAHNFQHLWLLVTICNVCTLIPIPLLHFIDEQQLGLDKNSTTHVHKKYVTVAGDQGMSRHTCT